MIILLFGFALLASAISVNKVLLFSISPLLLVAFRMFFAGTILYLWNIKRSQHLSWSYLKNDIAHLFVIALFVTFIPSLCKAYALQNMFSSKAALIGSLDPFVTALYSYLLWKEVLTPQKIMGIALGFIGALILCFSTSPLEKTLPSFLIFSLPEIAAFAAVAISRYGWILGQLLLKKNRYTPQEFNAITMLMSGIIALIASWHYNAFSSLSTTNTSVAFIVALLAYTIVIGNVFAYTMYAHALKRYSANFVSLAGFSTPLFVTFFGYCFLGESISASFFIAALVTLCGVTLFFHDELKTLEK